MKNICKRDFLLKLLVLFLTVLLLVFASFTKKDKDNTDNAGTVYDFAMGTSISVTLYPGSEMSAKESQELATLIVDEIKALDTKIISWREKDSELSSLNQKLNNGSRGESTSVSDELFCALMESIKICEDSKGALDITIRPLLECWGIESEDKEAFEVPSANEIASALGNVGYERINLDTEANTVAVEGESNIIIDLGATGKGYALDVIKSELDKNRIAGAVITVGGSVLVYKSKPGDEPWKVGIRNPRGKADDMMGYLELKPDDYMCVSTSGDYEKYVEMDGIRYHHILDRNNGYPATSGLSSVTVVCKSGIDSDGLSTACFILGMDASKKLLEQYKAEAVFVDTNGVVTVTDGLKENYKGN